MLRVDDGALTPRSRAWRESCQLGALLLAGVLVGCEATPVASPQGLPTLGRTEVPRLTTPANEANRPEQSSIGGDGFVEKLSKESPMTRDATPFGGVRRTLGFFDPDLTVEGMVNNNFRPVTCDGTNCYPYAFESLVCNRGWGRVDSTTSNNLVIGVDNKWQQGKLTMWNACAGSRTILRPIYITLGHDECVWVPHLDPGGLVAYTLPQNTWQWVDFQVDMNCWVAERDETNNTRRGWFHIVPPL